ncbi:hypothetical protein ABIE53_006218 [Burkholderia sp. OAS925]
MFGGAQKRQASVERAEPRLQVVEQRGDARPARVLGAVIRKREHMLRRIRAQRVDTRVDHAAHRARRVVVIARHRTQHLHRVRAVDGARYGRRIVQIGDRHLTTRVDERRGLRGVADHGTHVAARAPQRSRACVTHLAACSKNHEHVRLLIGSSWPDHKEACRKKRACLDADEQIRMVV